MKKNLASLLAVCMLAVSMLVFTACAARGTAGFVTQETLYASYEIPESWVVSEIHSSDARMLFLPAHISVMNEPSNVSVEIFPTGMPADRYQDIRDDFIQFMEDMLPMRGESAEILGHEHIETHFGEAIRSLINDDFEGRSFTQTQYYLLVDDYVAVVIATDFHDDDADDAADVARHIVDTIIFSDLADVPQPTMPPSPFGGEWNDNVYTNDILGINLELPEGWMPFTREMIAMTFGMEAEPFIALMAASDQDEMLQIFVSPNSPELAVADFLQDFALQTGSVLISEIAQVTIAGQVYYASLSTIEDGSGQTIIQETFARELDDSLILAIGFMYNEEAQSDALSFLEAAFGE